MEFRTSRGVVLPLGAVILVSVGLLITVLAKGESGFAVVVLCLLVPLSLLLFSWLMRRITVDGEGLSYKTLLRKRRVRWDEVKEVRLFTAGLRKVLYIDGGDRVLLIPVAMERREEFLGAVRSQLEGREISREGLETLSQGGGFWAEPLFLWLAALVLGVILLLRLR